MHLDDVPSLAHASVCSSSLPDWLCAALDVLAAILNSPFVLSLLGAAAGACMGALAATRLAARRQRRDELSTEIRSTNVAAMVALSMCHKVLGIKRTHLLPMITRFNSDRGQWNEFQRQRRTGERQGNLPPPITIDGSVIPSLSFPIVTLQRLLFDRVAMFGRSLALMATLMETSGWLVAANDRRNQLIDHIRKQTSAAAVAQLYFGALSPNGVADPEYPETVSAVARHADELIFFSATLAGDLAEHGLQLRDAWIREFGRKHAPEVTVVDFSAARKSGLMPDDAGLTEWLARLDRHLPTDQGL